MEPIQIIIAIFALFSLSRAFLRYNDTNVSFRELIFWTIIWGSVIVVALQPGFSSKIFSMFGIGGRPIDFITYISIILLFYLVFRLYVYYRSLEHDMTRIVREIAKNGKKR